MNATASKASRKITVEYPGGFREEAQSVDDGQARLSKSSHTGKIKVSSADQNEHGKSVNYREYREAGPEGRGWYFAGRIYIANKERIELPAKCPTCSLSRGHDGECVQIRRAGGAE